MQSLRVGLSSPHLGLWFFRQTPNGDGIWEDISFTLGGNDGNLDFLVVVDQPARSTLTNLPRERRLLIVTEPPEVFRYDKAFLDQFGTIVSFVPMPEASGAVVIRQLALPWFFGLSMTREGIHANLSWSELDAPAETVRDLELTAICSRKVITKNQVRRLRFLDKLKHRLGDRLQIFGRGFSPVLDKADILRRSRYHLALENSLQPNYWSEKLADAILGGAYPVHAGGAGADSLFTDAAYRRIDLRAPGAAVDAVEALLAEDPASKPEFDDAVALNRHRLMNEANFFAVYGAIIRDLARSAPPISRESAPVAIHPCQKPWTNRLSRLWRKPRSVLWRAQLVVTER